MTQPAQPQQQPLPDEATLADDAALIVAVASLLVQSPTPPMTTLVDRLVAKGIYRSAARSAAYLVANHPHPDILPIGPATRTMRRENALRRAQYLVSAAVRIARQVGKRPTAEKLADAVRVESVYHSAHVSARINREQRAATADSLASVVGPVLGWHSERDDRTSPECRAAHGKNFLITDIPNIGLPGAVHPHCRCRPTAPWPTRKTVDGGLLPPKVAAA